MRQQYDFHLHGVSCFTVGVLGFADVLPSVGQDGFVDAILTTPNVRPSLVEDPADARLRDSVCVAKESKAVAVEDDLLGRALARDDRSVDYHAHWDSVVGGIEDFKNKIGTF